jgi:hypothetical protein
LATPNYAYEKRQRELAKKRKKEEKLKRKSDSPGGSDAPERRPEPGTADGAPPDAGKT